MNVPTRIAGFAVGIGLVFLAALGVGHAVGPVGGAAGVDNVHDH